ncbi:MAG: ATP-dependent Clp protease adapter ClpS [Gammaproteobacteria bacterium]
MSSVKISQPQFDVILQTALPKLRKAPMYNVLLLNDDYTPMDFVVEILERFFYKDHTTAVQLMLQVHNQGKAICGTFPREIAETKVAVVNDYARMNQHPLMCKLEQVW